MGRGGPIVDSVELVRTGISIDKDLLERFDRIIERKGYTNRSEAIRDLIRAQLVEEAWASASGEVFGTITIMYDHHAGDVVQRLLEIQHHAKVHIHATTHIHVGPDTCVEAILVSGGAADVRALADEIRSLKGVRHGGLVVTARV